MSKTYRTAFAGSFASGVVMSPAPSLPDRPTIDPETGDAFDDHTCGEIKRNFERPGADERARGKAKAR